MKLAKQQARLASTAIDSDCVVIVNSSEGVTLVEAAATSDADLRHPRYGPIVGVNCPPDTTMVAYPFEVFVNRPDATFDTRLAVVVSRHDPAIVIATDGMRLHPIAGAAPVIDLGRRAMGMSTPEPEVPLIHLLDRIWFDRVLTAVLDSDLGLSPSWRALLALHPAMPQLCSPENLSTVRHHFRSTWSDFRQRVALAHIRWPGIEPKIADWLDDGSFSRWCVADTPEPDPIMADLTELLDPVISRRLQDALRPPPARFAISEHPSVLASSASHGARDRRKM